MIVTIPGLGTLTEEEFDWRASQPVDIQALGTRCRFIVDGFEPSEAASLAASVQSFCALTAAGLKREAGDHVWAYYRDLAARYVDEPGFPSISGAEVPADHARPDGVQGRSLMTGRRVHGVVDEAR